jgi:hypothetical protein
MTANRSAVGVYDWIVEYFANVGLPLDDDETTYDEPESPPRVMKQKTPGSSPAIGARKSSVKKPMSSLKKNSPTKEPSYLT